jgi:hypothetical protein
LSCDQECTGQCTWLGSCTEGETPECLPGTGSWARTAYGCTPTDPGCCSCDPPGREPDYDGEVFLTECF